jgi:hypothetical protein
VDFILPPLLHLRILVFRAHDKLPRRTAEHGEGAELTAVGGARSYAPEVTGADDCKDELLLAGDAVVVQRWGGRLALLRMDVVLLALGVMICAGTTTMAVTGIYTKVIERGTC